MVVVGEPATMTSRPYSSPSLLYSLHFWSGREELNIRETDFGVFRFHEKAELKEVFQEQGHRRNYVQDKLSFANLRGHVPSLEAKRSQGSRSAVGSATVKSTSLRQSLREFELLLAEQTVLYTAFRNGFLFQALMSGGILVNVWLNKLGDIFRITFDKFLVGRLLDCPPCAAAFSSRILVIAYLESRVTAVTFGKEVAEDFADFESLDKLDVKCTHVDILGPTGRRLPRQLLLSPDSMFILAWWASTAQEVFPWAPQLREQDVANVMLFSIKNPQEPKSLGFIKTLSDPLAFRFLSDPLSHLLAQPTVHQPVCVLHYLGQEEAAASAGSFQLENTLLHPVEGDRLLRRRNPQRMALDSRITCHLFVENLVILGCADGTLLVIDCILHTLDARTQCCFIPMVLCAHPDGALFMVASEKGVILCFDIALTPIRLQFAHEESLLPTASLALDASQYFRTQMSLLGAYFCPRAPAAAAGNALKAEECPLTAMATSYLALRFHGGPIVIARISGGVFSSGALGPTQIVNQYLSHQHYQSVLLLLNQLDWSRQGQTILTCLSVTFNKLSRCSSLGPDEEALMEMCLGLFHAPTKPIPEEVLDEYSEQVRDLSRKFFHLLLRRRHLAKAFQLAVDINDYDLFVDLYHVAAGAGMSDMAEAAITKARSIFNDASSASSPSNSSPPLSQQRPEILSSLPTASSVPLPISMTEATRFNLPVDEDNKEDEDEDEEDDDDHEEGNEEEEDLPPPPPTPPPLAAASQKFPRPPNISRTQQQQQGLPSPMQLFSAVTTVQVDHPVSQKQSPYGQNPQLLPQQPQFRPSVIQPRQQQQPNIQTHQESPKYLPQERHRYPSHPVQHQHQSASRYPALPVPITKPYFQKPPQPAFQQTPPFSGPVASANVRPQVLGIPVRSPRSAIVTVQEHRADLSGEPAAQEARSEHLRPQINATFTRTTAAKKIHTTEFKTPSKDAASLLRANIPNVSPEEAEDIKVIPLGIV